MAVYRCKKCNFIYSDDQQPDCFESVNEEQFKCPRCRCSKRMFEKISE